MKHKKIYILILTGIYIFFISIFNVKAEAYNWTWSGYQTNNYYSQPLNWYTDYSILKQSYDWRGNTFASDIGTVQFFNNGVIQIPSTVKYGIVKGYVYYTNSDGALGGVRLNNGNSRDTICTVESLSDVFSTIYQDGTISQSYGNSFYQFSCYVLPNQQFNNIEILTSPGTTSNWSAFLYQRLTIDYYYSDNSQSVSDIQNKMNEDISNSDKQAPDQTEYNNAKQQEDNIIQSISNVSANDITFSQDLNATNKIWDTTTRFLQTNAKVMGLVISILSIGIIKLIMNR